MPGVSVSREEHKMGLKGSSTARLILDDARIPLENLLYEPGKGHHVAFNALNIGRFKLSSMSLGPARDAMGLASRYAQDRRQFNAPLADFGLIRKKFATMAALYFAAEAMTYRTGALIDDAFAELGGTIDGNRAAAERYAVECSACKVFSTEAEAAIVDDAIQVHGGYGFTEEFPIARHYRDARVSRIFEGTNEINRLFMADRIAKKAKEGEISLEVSGDSFVSNLAGRALAIGPTDQIRIAACSDLLTLSFAEQSTRIRARRLGGIAQVAHDLLVSIVNARAAEAYQIATGEAVSLPAPANIDWDGLATAVYDRGGPL
jgi:hypothetical protein